MSIHADDELSLRIALESELDDVLPSDGLAGLVIERHRKIRRRRVAWVVSLIVVCAGIGLPLGLSGPNGKSPQQTGSVTPMPHARAGAALAGVASLALVCAGIGVRLGLSGPSGKPPQHDRGQRPEQQTGSVTPTPHDRPGAALVIELPASSLHRCASMGPEPDAAQLGVTRCKLRPGRPDLCASRVAPSSRVSRAERRISLVKRYCMQNTVRERRTACPDGGSPNQRATCSCQAGIWRRSDYLATRLTEAPLSPVQLTV